MGLNKFNLKFKQNRDKQLENSSKYCDDNCFEELSGEESIIDTLLRVHSSPIRWYNPIQNLLSEFDNGINTVIPATITPGSEHYNSYGVYSWTTTAGYDIKIHNQDRTLTENELKTYGSQCIGESTSDRIYDPQRHIIYRTAKSSMSKLGLISMNNPEKLPSVSTDTSRMHNQFTPFSSLLTTRNSKNKRNIQSDSFISTIGILDENNKAVPLRIPTDKCKLRSWTDGSSNKTGYYLTDCIAIVDIDNGIQIKNIMNAFREMPFQPQIVITEKGVGNTKQGNTTAQFIFNRPITNEERKSFITAIRAYIAFEHNIYAIDSKATGIGFGKNPILRYNGELTHKVYKLASDVCYNAIDVELMKEWSNEVNTSYEIPEGVDLYMIRNKSLMSSNISFEEILLNYAENIQNYKEEVITESLWSNNVSVGMRNNTLVYKEIPIFCLQYWLVNGIDIATLNASAISDNICHTIWYDIMQRYENSDGAVTWKYLYTRIYNCVEKDIKCIISKDEKFFERIKYQRNLILKTKQCKLLTLKGEAFSADKIKDLSQNYNVQGNWSYTQSQRGGMVQMLRSIMYAVVEHRAVLRGLIKDTTYSYEKFARDFHKTISFSEFQQIERNKIMKTLRGISANKKRQNILTNLIICNASMSANKIIQPISGRNVKLSTSNELNEENTSLVGFSFIHSAAFVSKMLYGSKEWEAELFQISQTIINELFRWVYQNKNINTFRDISAHQCTQFVQGLYNKYNIDTNIVYTLLKTISQGYINGHKLKDDIKDIFMTEMSIELVNSILYTNSIDGSSLLCNDYRNHDNTIEYHTRIYDIIVNVIQLFKFDGKLSKKNIVSFLNMIFEHMTTVIDSHQLTKLLSKMFDNFQDKLVGRLIMLFINSTIKHSTISSFIVKNMFNNLSTKAVSTCC